MSDIGIRERIPPGELSESGMAAQLNLGSISPRYPRDLASPQFKNFIQFHVREYKPFSNYRSIRGNDPNTPSSPVFPSGRAGSSIATVSLYMPHNVSAGYNARWANMEIGGFGQMVAGAYQGGAGNIVGAARNALNSSDTFEEASKSISGFLSDFRQGMAGGASTLALKAGRMLAGEELSNGLSAAAGWALNPHEEVLFEGVGFRTFPYQFKLAARTPQESQSIQDIIKIFKYYMMPSIPFRYTGTFFKYPNTFDILYCRNQGSSLSSEENPFLHKIENCALLDVNINYTGSGSYTTLKNGQPTELDLTLFFVELSVMTKEKIAEGF